MRNIIILAVVVILVCGIGFFGDEQIKECKTNNCPVCECQIGLGDSENPILCYSMRLSPMPCN